MWDFLKSPPHTHTHKALLNSQSHPAGPILHSHPIFRAAAFLSPPPLQQPPHSLWLRRWLYLLRPLCPLAQLHWGPWLHSSTHGLQIQVIVPTPGEQISFSLTVSMPYLSLKHPEVSHTCPCLSLQVNRKVNRSSLFASSGVFLIISNKHFWNSLEQTS